ncbi:MAG: PDZ domain-containing protein, partial [Acidobacteria bacterium]|nr:PDZ domain-containing protein [Acidobacteriota bacterium]
MRSLLPLPRWVLRSLAVLFAAATLAYSLIWMYYIQKESQVVLGLAWDRSGALRSASFPVTAVTPNSAAEEAGLKTGDRILAVNGQTLETLSDPLLAARFRARPGDVLRLKVQRAGLAAPLDVEIRFRPRPPVPPPTWAQRTVEGLLESYPLVFLVVGFVVLFLRLESPHAWVLAVLFGGFISSAPPADVGR